MKNDGHDTTVDYAGNWTKSFVTPLLTNPKFINKTLLVIVFDENETYAIKNNVWALLLGDVIPAGLRGSTDNTFYTHYSLISTIQNNWGLYSLGRGDVAADGSANVFEVVANQTGFKNIQVAAADIPYYNFTQSGYFDSKNEGPIPAVNETAMGAGGKGILPSLKGTNGSAIQPPTSSSSGSSSSASSSSSGSSSASSSVKPTVSLQLTGYVFAFVAFLIGLVV